MHLQGSVFLFNLVLQPTPIKLTMPKLPGNHHIVKSNMCFLVLALLDLWRVSDIDELLLLKSFFNGYVTKLVLSVLRSFVISPSSLCCSKVGVSKDLMLTFLPSF